MASMEKVYQGLESNVFKYNQNIFIVLVESQSCNESLVLTVSVK